MFKTKFCAALAGSVLLFMSCAPTQTRTDVGNSGHSASGTPANVNHNAPASSAGAANDNAKQDDGNHLNANAATSPEPGAAAAPAEFEGTAGVVEKRRGGTRTAVLREVRAARQAGFDRVVFEFAGDAGVPGYHVEYVDRPVRQCGSGEVVPVAGDAWLEVRLAPAAAHTEAGEPTVKDHARRVNLTNLKEMKSTCDFEAEVEWVLGVASPNRYRVLELSNPPRLVVDIRH